MIATFLKSHKTDLKAVILYLFALFRALEIFVRVEVGEKGIRAAVGIHFRDEHFFAVGQKRPIDALSADDVNILVSALFHLLFQSVKIPYDDTVVPYLSPGKYDIDAIFKRLAAGKRAKGISSHHHRLPARRFAKKLHIPGDREHERIIFADSPMFVGVQDRADHIATGILLSSFSYS